jgi:hypothetical protein
MPSPRIRAKRLRDTLTEAEEIELVLGPEAGHPSLFASAAERGGRPCTPGPYPRGPRRHVGAPGIGPDHA